MQSDDVHNAKRGGVSENADTVSDATPKYKMLGESGLVEDDEGNVYSANEIYPTGDVRTEKKSSHERLKGFGVAGELDDKCNPAHWYYDYDPRYCGPDREKWMLMMARKHRREARKKKFKAWFDSLTLQQKAKKTLKPQDIKSYGVRPVYRTKYTYVNSMGFEGIVDIRGNIIVDDKKYCFASQYSDDRAMVQDRKTKKFGFVNRRGEEVVPCVWRSAGMFSEFMAGVQDDNGRCGFINTRGEVVIPCRWRDVWPFNDGFAKVLGDRRLGMINSLGDVVIECKWKGMTNCSEGLVGVRGDDGLCGFIDTSGVEVIPRQWRQVWEFRDGLAVVQNSDKRLGFINHSGELVVPCEWKKVRYFVGGIAKVSKSKRWLLWDKWVYINRKGEVVK